jgi:hypothetical protein
MSEEQSAGVTVIYGGQETAVNFPKARWVNVDAQGVLTLSMDMNNDVAVFSAGTWTRVFNMNVDQPKMVADPGDQ